MDTPNILGLQLNTKVFFSLIYYRRYLCLKKALFQVFWKYFFMYLNTSICVFLLFDMTCIFTEQKSFLIALLHISTRDGWTYVVFNTLQTFLTIYNTKFWTLRTRLESIISPLDTVKYLFNAFVLIILIKNMTPTSFC